MTVFVEEKEELAYYMSLDTNTKYFSVVESNVPNEYRIYERKTDNNSFKKIQR